MPKKLTNEEFLEKLYNIRDDVHPQEGYKGANTKILVLFDGCDCGPAETTPNNLYKGRGCNICKTQKKLTNEEFLKKLYSLRSDATPLEQYINSHTKILVQFSNCDHGPCMSRPDALYEGDGCRKCAYEAQSVSRRLSSAEFVENLYKKRQDVHPQEEYKGLKTKILFSFDGCSCPAQLVVPHNILEGSKCPGCKQEKRNEEFLKKLYSLRSDATPLEPYKGRDVKIKVLFDGCDCGPAETTPNSLYEGHGCNICKTNKKLTNEEYDKQLLGKGIDVIRIGNYEGHYIKILHKYPCGCVKLSAPYTIKKGNNCQDCSIAKSPTTEEYKQQLIDMGIKAIPLEPYINSKTKILHDFQCGHPPVLITPNEIKRGNGCRQCWVLRSAIEKRDTHEDFLDWAFKERFMDFFPLEKYVNARTKIKVLWFECGCTTKVVPDSLKSQRSGCSNCKKSTSKKEKKWIKKTEESLGRELIKQYSFNPNNRKYKSDGYDLVTNTIYEFYGDIWHGNPESKRYFNNNKEFHEERYQETVERENLIKKLGYNLITIWESDYDKLNSP